VEPVVARMRPAGRPGVLAGSFTARQSGSSPRATYDLLVEGKQG